MSFNENQLVKRLGELPLRNRVAFAASCCERLIPNYKAFYLQSHWGDVSLLNCALELVWKFVRGGSCPSLEVPDLIDQCEALIPDSDEFTSIFTGAAANAAASVIYTLHSCLDGDPKRLALVGRLAIDTIDEFLYLVNAPSTGYEAHDPTFDQWIQQAPLMRAELERQEHDLATLTSQTKVDSCSVHKLRNSGVKVGLFPIERGLIVPYSACPGSESALVWKEQNASHLATGIK